MELEARNQTALERIKQLDAEREQILGEAKRAALTKAREAVAELNALGSPFELIEAAGSTSKRKPKRSKCGPCSVCEFVTVPPHDARRHRFQGADKQPFTDDQLAELGLART